MQTSPRQRRSWGYTRTIFVPENESSSRNAQALRSKYARLSMVSSSNPMPEAAYRAKVRGMLACAVGTWNARPFQTRVLPRFNPYVPVIQRRCANRNEHFTRANFRISHLDHRELMNA